MARLMQLHSVICTHPFIAGACRDSRSRHAGLYHHLNGLYLDQEGTSHAKTCPLQPAAQCRRWQQLTPFFLPSLWHPGRLFLSFPYSQTCPFLKLSEGAGVDKGGRVAAVAMGRAGSSILEV